MLLPYILYSIVWRTMAMVSFIYLFPFATKNVIHADELSAITTSSAANMIMPHYFMFLNLIPYFLSLVVQGEFQTINRRNQQWFLSRSVPTRCVFSRIAKPYAWIASPILQNGTIWFTHVKMVHALSLISESYKRSFPPPIPFSHAGWYNLVYPCNDGTFPLISGSYTRTYTATPSPSHMQDGASWFTHVTMVHFP